MKANKLLGVLASLATACAVLAGTATHALAADTTLRFALDWTPNTDHTGLFVAIDKGYFKDAGITVKVLPYNSTPPDALVSAGAAEFGTTFQDAVSFSMAAGANVKSVFAVDQHWASSIGVLKSRTDITSPAQLDGKNFGGVGTPGERAIVSQVIKNAGGKGDFKLITLRSSYIEALEQGKVDFALPYMAWEGLEAERAGKPVKYFKYTDFGFPDAYAVVVVGNRDWLAKNPDVARKFVQALQKGYEFAAANPKEAAEILIKANPQRVPGQGFRHQEPGDAEPGLSRCAGQGGPPDAQAVARIVGLSL